MSALTVVCVALLASPGQSDPAVPRLIGLPGGAAMFELTPEGKFRAGVAEYRLVVGDEEVAIESAAWQRVEGWLPAFESEVEVRGVAYRCRLFADGTTGGPVGAVRVEVRNVHLARRQAKVRLERLGKGWIMVQHEQGRPWDEAPGEGDGMVRQVVLGRGEGTWLSLGIAGVPSGEPPEWERSVAIWRDAVEKEGVIRTPDRALNLLWKRSLARLLLAGEQARAEAEQQAREVVQEAESTGLRPLPADDDGEMSLAQAARAKALVRRMVVREEGQVLHLFPDIPAEWAAAGNLAYVAQLPTAWGRATWFFKGKHGWGEVVIYPPLGERPEGFVLHVPDGLVVAKAVVDGEELPAPERRAVRLPPDAHEVHLTWAGERPRDEREDAQAPAREQ